MLHSAITEQEKSPYILYIWHDFRIKLEEIALEKNE